MSPPRKTPRPLTARSVLASVLLGTDPPWLPTPVLVRTTALFGISEGSTRTALSRLVATGDAVAERGGYRLVGRLVARQQRQSASRRAETRAWDGTWELVVVTNDAPRPAADRATLRDALRALRFAELREGVWARPDNLDPSRSAEAAAVVRRWCDRWGGARPEGPPPVEDLFGLGVWARGASSLRADMGRLLGPLERRDTEALAAGFVTSAAVLRHLQADPLLPDALLPRGWPGAALRAEYDRYDAAYRATLADWFRAET